MFEATSQPTGAVPRFLPFNASPAIPGLGYATPQSYQTQLQPQLQLIPVLTPQGWVGYVIATLVQPANGFGSVGLGQNASLGNQQGIPAGFGFAPFPIQQHIPQTPFTWQQPQLPWQQQSPWQLQTSWQQPSFNQFAGHPFAGGLGH